MKGKGCKGVDEIRKTIKDLVWEGDPVDSKENLYYMGEKIASFCLRNENTGD